MPICNRPAKLPFELVPGGVPVATRGRTVRVFLAPLALTIPLDAQVIEEDTHLIMSAPAEIRDVDEHPVRLMTELAGHRGLTPGIAVVQGRSRPWRILAIVHDVDRSPTWREDWVASALRDALALAERRQVRELGLPFLAARHGRLAPERFCRILAGVLGRLPIEHLEGIWLVPGRNELPDRSAVMTALATGSGGPGSPRGGPGAGSAAS